jgi:hypothetical protein
MIVASQWLVLSRPDCSLCETLLQELMELPGVRAEQVQVQDISGDVELERKYGQRIPVLLIDGEFVCAYRLDRARLGAYLPR